MSKTIDERVVSMQFDNSRFERNVATSMSTLDKLKQSLKFTGATKGLENVNTAAKNVNLNGLSTAADQVSVRFSHMQMAIQHQFDRIVDSAFAAGKRIVSALTIDPVKTGFQEYETQMNAVQTILANTQSKGSTLDDVNNALELLNVYADKTIYNFTEMTRNIGTFTAAGVDLQTSVDSIKGIANLAAVSGSSSQQASTAMYQLSQALAAGRVSLMDWNSVVNAGMGGELFQNALIRTSELLKTGAKDAIDTYGSFRESLTQGEWLTTEVLTETLKQISGAYSEADLIAQGFTEAQAKEITQLAETASDAATKVKTFTQLWDVMKESAQSGWAQTWKLIIGDFEQAKSLLTPLADFFTGDDGIITKISNARNELLESALGKGVSDMFTGLNKALKTTKKGAEGVVKPTKDASNALKDLSVVDEVWAGKWDTWKVRFDKLTDAGYNYCRVQNEINKQKGVSFRYTDEEIAAQDKLLGRMDKATKVTDEKAMATGRLSDADKEAFKAMGKMAEGTDLSNKYTEEQIAAFNELASTAEKLGIPFDEFIDNMDEINGRWLLIGSFKNIGQGLVSVITAIAKAWRDVFPPMQADQLFNLIAGFHKLTSYLKVNEEAADKFQRVFRGLFAAFDIVLTVIGGPLKIAFKILTEILGAFDMNILDLAANIGDSIYKFKEFLDSILDFGAIFKSILPYIKSAIDAVKQWFIELKNSELAKSIIDGLANGLTAGIARIRDAAIELGTKLINAIKEILGIHSPSTVMFEIGENIVQGLVNGITSGIQWIIDSVKFICKKISEFFGNMNIDFSGISNGFDSFIAKIKELTSGFDWKNLLAIIPVGVVLVIVKKIVDIVTALADGINSINDVIDGFADLEKKFSKVLNAYATNLKAEALKKVAEALLMLVGAIVVLTLLDTTKMVEAVTVVVILAGVLAALSFAVNKMSDASAKLGKDGLEIKGFQTTMVSLGIALLLLAAAVKMVGILDPNQAKQGFLGLAGLVAALVIVFAAYGKLVKGKAAQNIDKAGIMLVKMSIAMLLMIAICKLAGKLSPDEMKNGAKFIGAFIIFTTFLIGIATLDKGTKIAKLGGMLIKISIALGLMIAVCKLVGTLTPDDMKNGALFVGAFLIFLSLLVGICTMDSGTELAKLGGIMLSVSMSLLLMIGVCKLAEKITPEGITNAIYVASMFMLLIAGLVMVAKFGGKDMGKIAGTMIAASIAIGLLAAVCVLIGMVDPSILWNGVAAVTVLGLMLAAMIAATKGASKVVGNLVVMTIAIAVLAGIIALLSMIEPEKLEAPTIAMTMLMGMFAIIASAAGNMQTSALTIFAMAAVVGVLGGVLYLISGLPVESTLGNVANLSILMMMFAVVMRIIGGMTAPSGMALVAIGVMTLVVAALAGILYLLQGVNPTQGIAIVGVISAFLAALLVAVAAMQLLQAPSLIGLAALAIVTLVVAALAGILYLMQDVDPSQAIGIVGAISLFLAAMVGVCIAAAGVGALASLAIPGLAILVAFIGALGLVVIGLAALAMDVIAGMPQLGSDLSAFMTNVQPFIDGIQAIPDNISDKIGTLCGAILKLTGTELLTSIADFLSGGSSSLSDLGAELKTFGDSLVAFSAGAANMDMVISTIGKIKEISITSEEFDISGLTSFGNALLGYANNVATVNHEAIALSIASGLRIAAFIRSLAGIDTSGVAAFNAAMTQLANTNISSFITAFTNATTNLTSVGAGMIDALKRGIISKQGDLQTAAVDLLTFISICAKNKVAEFELTGIELVDAIVKGVESKATDFSSALGSMISEAASSANGYYDSFESAGAYCVSGFVAGINNNKYKASNAGGALAAAALQAAIRRLAVASPSKEFYKIGDFAGQGFVNALTEYEDVSYKSASAMAGSAMEGLSDTISKIKSAIDSDMDVNPTIRPVLDLSNVQNGANSINSMFANRTLALAGINADHARIDSEMNLTDVIAKMQKMNDDSNRSVVNAITNLRGDFGSLVEAIGGMHIRMDSGTVVGELIGKIDSGLGRIATHKGRGI